jgi:acetoacetyl-CoA synthetase
MSEILWQPDAHRIQESRMYRFLTAVRGNFSLILEDYSQLYDWSIQNPEKFWEFYFSFSGISFHKPPVQTLTSRTMPGARWFEGAELNYTENLLNGSPDRVAIISKVEDRPMECLTHGELRREVFRFAEALKRAGVGMGDRVAGYMPNIPETVIAMLGAAAVGAVWTSCSPDFGLQGVKDRFGQIEPKILITVDGYIYKGKTFSILKSVNDLCTDLSGLEQVIIVPFLYPSFQTDIIHLPIVKTWEEFTKDVAVREFQFESFPFNHPLFILYSSGTTGAPKCIVHGTGGTLLQHHKEHALHTDIGPDDVVFYFTTCGWMMWNWLVSALAQKATIVLYEGSPAYPSLDVLWNLIDEAKITVFGTSAKFISMNKKEGIAPNNRSRFESLKTVLSTGSPLDKEGFRWVYRNVKKNLQLSSISGGTDIISCFVLGNPMLPVRAGEIQCRGLGMDVVAQDEGNTPVVNQKGELACRFPSPSMPIYFWRDPDNSKYLHSYFGKVPGVWVHGDFIEIKDHGGVIIYGRSDATLNPGGIRIGTAEIYKTVEGMDEVVDSLVIGVEEDNDIKIILFVLLREGMVLNEALEKKIKIHLREQATPRHVPHEIFSVSDIPRTLNGKKVELTVRNIFMDEPVSNRAALANPDCLNEYEEIKLSRLVCR